MLLCVTDKTLRQAQGDSRGVAQGDRCVVAQGDRISTLSF